MTYTVSSGTLNPTQLNCSVRQKKIYIDSVHQDMKELKITAEDTRDWVNQ